MVDTSEKIQSILDKNALTIQEVDALLALGQNIETENLLLATKAKLNSSRVNLSALQTSIANTASILSGYGVTISASNPFPPQTDERQIKLVLYAVEQTAGRLAVILQGCSDPCKSDYANLSKQQLFQRVFGQLEIKWDATNPYSRVDKDVTPQAIILGGTAFFDDFPSNTVFENDNVTRDIIIHELGHVFHNRLQDIQGPVENYNFVTSGVTGVTDALNSGIVHITIPQVSAGGDQYINYQMSISRQSTPLVVVDFLTETQGYWTGDTGAVDTGSQRTSGSFTKAEADARVDIVPLTNFTLGFVNTPCATCNLQEFLVALGGFCIEQNGSCISPDSSDSRAVYIRRRGTYTPGRFDPSTNQADFSNEQGIDSVPLPKEGFADTFKIHLRSVLGISELPPNESRRLFFENDNRFCQWVCQILEQV